MLVSIIMAAGDNIPTSGEPLVDFLFRAGATGILAFGIVGFMRGWIVPGKEVQRVRDERDRALELVYKQAELTQRALEISSEKNR